MQEVDGVMGKLSMAEAGHSAERQDGKTSWSVVKETLKFVASFQILGTEEINQF